MTCSPRERFPVSDRSGTERILNCLVVGILLVDGVKQGNYVFIVAEPKVAVSKKKERLPVSRVIFAQG